MIMNEEKNPMAQRILDLTLEIIYLLTGEDHVLVKNPGASFAESSRNQVYEGSYKTQRPSTEPSSPSPIHEQKILELTHRILRLLTGEVPIRCEDVTVHLSVEEWEYVERHKDLYQDLMMEDHQTVITADGFHSPVSPPDSETKNGIANITETGGKHPKNNSREDEAVTNPPCTSLLSDRGNLMDTEIYPTTEHSSGDVKEEPASWEEGTLTLTEVDVYKPTEHTKTEYPCIDIAEEPASCEEGNPMDSFTYKPTEHSQSDCPPVNVKEEPASCVRGHFLGKGDRPFKCIECGKGYSTKSNLVKHYRIHTAEKPFKCTDCGRRFFSETDLVSHQAVQTGERPFKCTECGTCFSHTAHLACDKVIHTEEKPFRCSECGNRFTRASSLAMHKMIHTGERPFSCAECGKCFTQAAHLARHKMIHTGEKPFTCAECGKCFTQASDLAGHKMTHTGEKRFICSDCGKGFNRRYRFIQHQETHKR